MKKFDNALGVVVWGGIFLLMIASVVSVCIPGLVYIIGAIAMAWGILCIIGVMFVIGMDVKKNGWPDGGWSG